MIPERDWYFQEKSRCISYDKKLIFYNHSIWLLLGNSLLLPAFFLFLSTSYHLRLVLLFHFLIAEDVMDASPSTFLRMTCVQMMILRKLFLSRWR